MVDFLLAVVTNGFYLYLVTGYYKLLWNRQAERRILLICAALFFGILLNVFCYLVDDDHLTLAGLSMAAIVVLMVGGVSVYNILSYGLERQRLLREQLIQQQIECLQIQYHTIEQQQAETRRQRHELKNMYLVMDTMIKKQDLKGLQEFIREQSHMLYTQQGKAATGNAVVDAVLNYRMEQEYARTIDFSLNLSIPVSMDVKDVVLSGVLGNALDNAIEASLHLPEDARKISISMYIDRKNLFIEMTNNFDGMVLTDSKGNLLTRKQEKESHGFGISVMKELLEQHSGNINLVWSDRQFQVQILFYHAV